MKRLVWIVTGFVIVIWSLVAWAAHGLVGAAGNFVAGNADLLPADPLLVEWGSWLASAGTGIGEVLVILIWAFVTAVLLALGAVAARLLPRRLAGR